jgi:hypothetical protein
LSDTLPWSLCLPAVVMAWRADRKSGREPDALRIRTLLLLWIAVTVVFFSLSQTKQDLYIFPIVTAVAALGGDWVARVLRSVRLQSDPGGSPEGGHYDFRWTFTVFGIVMAALGAAVLYLFSGDRTVYVDGARAAAMIAIVGGMVAFILPWRRRYVATVACVLIVLIAFNWILAVRSLPDFERYKPVVPLSRIIEERADADDVVAHLDVALPSMVYYLNRHIDIGMDSDTLSRQLRSERRVFAVMPADRYEALKGLFGVETCIVGRHHTSDIRLRSLLERQPPPEVLVISNRCPA